MKKRTVIGLLVVALALALSAPRLLERQLPVDAELAASLVSIESENLGETIVNCLNRRNETGVWWDLLPADHLTAYLDANAGSHGVPIVVTGRAGWSVSWAAVVDWDNDVLTAFETFGAKGCEDGSFHRSELPIRIIGSFKRCGVAFGGVYPGEIVGH